MRRPPLFRRLIQLPSTRHSIRGEIDDEIRFHIDSRVEELVARGVPSSDAPEIAEREYGNTAASAREIADVDQRRLGQTHRQELLASIGDDVRYAFRRLRRERATTAVIILTLTIGIAANAVMFGVVDQLLLRPPAFVTAPDGVKRIYLTGQYDGKAYATPSTSFPTLAALRAGVPAFAQVAGVARGNFTLSRGPDARGVDVDVVTGNYFSTVGVPAALGRTIGEADDVAPDGNPVVVISDGLWKREFGAKPSAIGKLIEINGRRVTVVGVTPEGFNGLDEFNVDMWMPISVGGADAGFGKDWRTSSQSYWLQTIGRLKIGATPEQAMQQGTAAYRGMQKQLDQPFADTLVRVGLGPLTTMRTPTGLTADARVAVGLFAVSGAVFLIACANVMNLLIAGIVRRRGELAVRLALGVGRARLLQQLLTEALLLAVLSGLASLLVARWGSGLVQSLLLPGIAWQHDVIGWRVVAFTGGAALICALAAGVVPALQGLGTSVSDSLKASSRTVAGERRFLRATLLATQAALSIVLLIGAGLFVKTLRHVSERDVGIQLDRVLLVRMNLARAGITGPAATETYRESIERIKAIPGVVAAASMAGTVPMATGSGMSVQVPGEEKRVELPGGGPYYVASAGDVFAAMGTKLVAGRVFTPAEEHAPTRVMIVNEQVASGFFPNESAVGKCVTLGSDATCTTIIGVVHSPVLFSLVRDDRGLLYLPPVHPMVTRETPTAILVRTAFDPELAVPMIRQRLQSLSANMPFVSVASYEQLIAPQMRPWRLGATMFTLFGVLAMIIAAVGLYSVLAYWVSQRTHEIGIRLALGAQARDVIALVAREGSTPILVGLAIGIAIALVASRWVTELLYETSPHDPLVYAVAAALLGVAGIIASARPALRSTSVDPVKALRAD